MNSNIKQYLKEVSAKLSCPKGVKAIFLRQLKSEIIAFADNNTTITVDELYRQFGTPEEIADGFFDRDDYSTMLKKAKKHAAFWMVLCVVLTVILIVFLCYFAYVIKNMSGTFEYSAPIEATNTLRNIFYFGGLH